LFRRGLDNRRVLWYYRISWKGGDIMELEVTQHVLERFEERVTAKYSNKPTFYKKVKEWCENSVKNGKLLGVDHNGYELHRSSNFVLIIKGGNVITIKPAENETEEYYAVENTVKQTVKSSIQDRKSHV